MTKATTQHEQRIIEMKEAGFFHFKSLANKLIQIKSYKISNNGKVDFVLESKFGEEYEFECETKDLDDFLTNFTTETTVIPTYLAERKQQQTGESEVAAIQISNIADVRCILFDTLQKLQSHQMDVVRADSISKVSQVIINSVKLEMQYKAQISDKSKMPVLEENIAK